MKNVMFSIILILVKLLVLEGLAGLGILYLRHKKNIEYRPVIKDRFSEEQRKMVRKILDGEAKYIAHSPKLGWTIAPNGARDEYRANSQGLRADHDYSLTPGDKIRIATFGDSFVHCDEVPNDQTWQEHLNRLDSRLETMNFGVGGYGMDQAYLRYLQDGKQFHPDIVLIGFMTENPTRNMTIFRPFYLPHSMLPLSKPRFTLKDGQLVLIENPLDDLSDYQRLLDEERTVRLELSHDDYFFYYRYGQHPLDFFLTVRLFKILKSMYMKPQNEIFDGYLYSAKSDIFKVSMAIIEDFAATVRKEGAIPIVVFLPNSGDFWRLKEHSVKNYRPFMEIMDEKGIPYFDFTTEFLDEILKDEDPATFYSPQYHFSGKGNAYVARHIYRRLKEGGYLDEARRRRPGSR
ncbi:MAG: SGNH/GDSL hydrolase family protein [Candidatus Omnitrophica bacterium]|nr:SGNH/GDSL hydrolase family protein [Candidatus Omnitrophota bacterium]MCB9720386.1 SGNH/GDSL hydrolase family protein [Candidatus Omnitrophota bacterium]